MGKESKSIWATPQSLFDKLNAEFHFELDVCALPENAKCVRYFTPEQNGLEQRWGATSCYNSSFWMNPPYGREIGLWLKKAYEVSGSGVRVVALVPNHSNAPWWHDYCMKAREIRFIRKKVPFSGPIKGVPFWGSCLIVFGPGVSFDTPRVSSYDQ